jgi:hypothetical protein
MNEPSQPTRAEWRPQRFGRLNGRKVIDPLLEPVWVGERVLVHVERSGPRTVTGQPYVAIRDEAGEPVDAFPDVAEAIGAAARARALVIDGYLTDRIESARERAVMSAIALPTAGDHARQMLLGAGRRREGLEPLDRSVQVDPAVPTTFVAVDLLMVDDDELLDVPLLERKRLLESVLDENRLVRLGLYVRPPLASWLASWRSIGFNAIAFKAANGRYQPGCDNDGWAISKIPLR